VQQVRDRAVVAVRLQLVEERAEHVVDLLRAGRTDSFPPGVALEVDDALVPPPEPVAQPGRAQVRHPENLAQAEHRHRLQVVRHQLGPAAPGQPVERELGYRPDQVIDVAVDAPRPVLGVQRTPQLVMALPVDGDDGRGAEGAVDGRVVQLGGELLRVGPDELHILVPGDEPQSYGGDEAHGGIAAEPRVDRVGIRLQRFHRDGPGEIRDRAAAHARIVWTRTIGVKERDAGESGSAGNLGDWRSVTADQSGP